MNTELIEKINGYIKNMPSLPTSLAKVLEICNNPQTSPADLNQVISLDPVLVGRVLKLINSAYYSLGSPVKSLVRAIIMLGINTVKNLALSTTVVGTLSSGRDSAGLNMEGFWRHSLCVGVASKFLAKKRGIDPKLTEEYFTAGLLHDIGKIPLNAVLGKNYMPALGAAGLERIPFFRAEDKTLGLDHCAAGEAIANAWKLEGPVKDAIVYHHFPGDYEGAFTDVLFTVAAANSFACMVDIGFAGDRHPDIIGKDLWNALGVTREAFDEIEPLVNGEIQRAEIFLKL